jgi:hypothetical protein
LNLSDPFSPPRKSSYSSLPSPGSCCHRHYAHATSSRTKLKRAEVDYESMKRCCEVLTEENRLLQKEVWELRALKLVSQNYCSTYQSFLISSFLGKLFLISSLLGK